MSNEIAEARKIIAQELKGFRDTYVLNAACLIMEYVPTATVEQRDAAAEAMVHIFFDEALAEAVKRKEETVEDKKEVCADCKAWEQGGKNYCEIHRMRMPSQARPCLRFERRIGSLTEKEIEVDKRLAVLEKKFEEQKKWLAGYHENIEKKVGWLEKEKDNFTSRLNDHARLLETLDVLVTENDERIAKLESSTTKTTMRFDSWIGDLQNRIKNLESHGVYHDVSIGASSVGKRLGELEKVQSKMISDSQRRYDWMDELEAKHKELQDYSVVLSNKLHAHLQEDKSVPPTAPDPSTKIPPEFWERLKNKEETLEHARAFGSPACPDSVEKRPDPFRIEFWERAEKNGLTSCPPGTFGNSCSAHGSYDGMRAALWHQWFLDIARENNGK